MEYNNWCPYSNAGCLNGKDILIVGTSNETHYTTVSWFPTWPEKVKQMLAGVANVDYNGEGRLLWQTAAKAQEMLSTKDYDIVIISQGRNDASVNNRLGTFLSPEPGTFFAGFQTLRSLCLTYPDTEFYFLGPYKPYVGATNGMHIPFALYQLAGWAGCQWAGPTYVNTYTFFGNYPSGTRATTIDGNHFDQLYSDRAARNVVKLLTNGATCSAIEPVNMWKNIMPFIGDFFENINSSITITSAEMRVSNSGCSFSMTLDTNAPISKGSILMHATTVMRDILGTGGVNLVFHSGHYNSTTLDHVLYGSASNNIITTTDWAAGSHYIVAEFVPQFMRSLL